MTDSPSPLRAAPDPRENCSRWDGEQCWNPIEGSECQCAPLSGERRDKEYAAYRYNGPLRRAAPALPAEPPTTDAKDAARYRWLRDGRAVEMMGYPSPPWAVRCELDPWPTNKRIEGVELDAAIDAAMGAAPGAAQTAEPIEIRLNVDGTLDEVVGGRGVHLEQMSPTHWWLAAYDGSKDGRVTVNFHAKSKITANVEREGAAGAAQTAKPGYISGSGWTTGVVQGEKA